MLVVDVSLVVGSNTGAASEVGLAIVMAVVEGEGLLRVWVETGDGEELAGEVVEDNLDVTSGLVVDVGCGEGKSSVDAAESVAGAVMSVDVLGDC